MQNSQDYEIIQEIRHNQGSFASKLNAKASSH